MAAITYTEYVLACPCGNAVRGGKHSESSVECDCGRVYAADIIRTRGTETVHTLTADPQCESGRMYFLTQSYVDRWNRRHNGPRS